MFNHMKKFFSPETLEEEIQTHYREQVRKVINYEHDLVQARYNLAREKARLRLYALRLSTAGGDMGNGRASLRISNIRDNHQRAG